MYRETTVEELSGDCVNNVIVSKRTSLNMVHRNSKKIKSVNEFKLVSKSNSWLAGFNKAGIYEKPWSGIFSKSNHR